MLHPGDILPDRFNVGGSALHAPSDLGGRAALLFHRGCDGGCDGADREIVSMISRMAATASLVADWIWLIWLLISSVALAVWPARPFTSDATTAKPLPASPARAASMVALRASTSSQ
jgi:hypothetical protein